jgi:rhodanese-related sulfurtransferase
MSKVAGVGCADVLVDAGDAVRFGSEALEVRPTPGHTHCSVSFVHHGSRRVFTGDALLIRGCGRTDFQQGDPRTLYRSVHEQIFSLADDYGIYPGHDYKGRTMSTVAEEKAHNPRLGGGKSETEFVEIMNSLDLPRPKMIDVAVPANQKCGFERLQKAEGGAQAADWAPVARTPGGVPEVSVEWVRDHVEEVRIIDVREANEFYGELGHVRQAELVPQGVLPETAESWPKDEPFVVLCRSGGRSGRAAKLLEEMGFSRVASMAGGMLRWNELKAPLAS